MKKKPEDYLKEPYSRALLPEEDGRFSAELLEFPGCFAQGENPTEAFNNLEKAAKSWIQASLDQGLEIPPPALNQNYSGKIALRIPRSLHKRAAQMAECDGTSLNQFLITAIATRIGAEEYHSYLCRELEQRFTDKISNNINLYAPSARPLIQKASNREGIHVWRKSSTMHSTIEKSQNF
ncbi:MAG: type II toxin-antitoxin system HicB family antitoxin [Deltaproteobacteria bacterium]|nr:type II toxin-antitoxin system HicB family antitoxin [Deltaproteobacteria bacterium]MBF0524430.1 type II toxin-antitoxin system HicB family antitoxin [Deltaproteobacteria bacterium]